MAHLLILGGSGFVGRHLCEKLVRAGHRLTVPTRSSAHSREVQMLPGLEVLEADVHDAALLTRLMAGHDAVFNLIAILHGTESAFEHVHVTLPQRIAAACRAAGVKRLLHVSALGVSANAPSRYLRSKARGEQVLQDAGLDLTLLRPSVIFGREDRFLNTFAALQSVFPLMPLAGAYARFQPVWVEDVAQALVNAYTRHEAIGTTYEACGPDVLTLRELVQLAGRLSGHPRPVLPLPDAIGRLQATLMEHLPGPTLMSRDNLDSMRADNVATGLPGIDTLGVTPASIHAIAPSYLVPPSTERGLDRLRNQHARR